MRYFFLYDEVMNTARKSFFTSSTTFLQLVNLLVWAGVACTAVVLVLRWSEGADEGVPLIVGIEQKQVSPDVDS